MSGASSSTYPENLGSGGQLSAELGGRVCLFLFFFVRHATLLGTESPDGSYIRIELGGTDIRPQDSFQCRIKVGAIDAAALGPFVK